MATRYSERPADRQQLRDVVRHLRNKNLMIVEDAPSLLDRFLKRLLGWVTSLRHRHLRLRWDASARLVVSEQIVENPVVWNSLRDSDRRILDFGGFEGVLPLQLAALGREVWVLDQRRYPFAHPNLRTVCADILRDPLDFGGPFDLVVSVSTIEHVGLGDYGDALAGDGDAQAVRRLWSFVRPGGRLIASVPAGRPATQRGYRVYDEARLRTTFPDAKRVRWFMKDTREGAWMEVEAAAVAGLVYEQPLGEAPAQGVAIVECEKPA